MDISLAAYKTPFLLSAKADVHAIKQAVSALGKNTTDSRSLETLFIQSHSLKGKSMTMGYSGIAKAALAIERYARSVRDGERVLDSEILPVIQHALAKIQSALEKIEANDTEGSLSGVITELEQKLSVKI